MTAELARRGTPCGHKTVETMMRNHRILARRHRGRRRGLTAPDPIAPAWLDPDGINHTWAGDVTYAPTDEGWLYLASVLELGSRRLIGYAMSERADTDHVIDAVAMAVATRGRAAMDGTIFHSDRESTYTSGSGDRATCADLGLRQSTADRVVPG